MKKLVTVLIIVLPIVLLIALFAVTGIVLISADIPATGITINRKGEDGVLFFDLSDYSEPLYESELGVQVMPLVASDKGYNLTITDTNGNPCDIVTRDENGAFRLHGIGIAKLTYSSRDGGYSDSVLFNITANEAIDFTPVLKDLNGNEIALEIGDECDYKVTLLSGKYSISAKCYPQIVQLSNLEITTVNDKIIALTDTNGGFNAVFGGKTVISVCAKGVAKTIKKTIEIEVLPAAEVIIDGGAATIIGRPARVNAALNCADVNFALQCKTPVTSGAISIEGTDILPSAEIKQIGGLESAFSIKLHLEKPYAYETSVRYTLSLADKKYDFYIDYKEYEFSVSANTNCCDDEVIALVGSNVNIAVACNPLADNIRYEFMLQSDSAFTLLSQNKNRCVICANDVGETDLQIAWTQTDKNGNQIASGTIDKKIVAIQGYSSMLFAENASDNGLGILAIASNKFDDSRAVANSYLSRFRAYNRMGSSVSDIQDIEFSVSDKSLLDVERTQEGIQFVAKSTGVVTVMAIWKHGDLFGVQPATLTVQTADGIEVYDDDSLRRAFNQGRAVVLANDIYLGENLFDTDEYGMRVPKYEDRVMREKLLQYTGEIKTTGDYKYYENIGLEQPSVRYCLDITANIYGNGHFISAQYITDMLDNTDNPYDFALFKGPLDFVATNSNGLRLAAVKGQDNIVFLIRTDGVVVDNAVLKGCDDSAIYENDAINLSLLNSMGTTLEIMSDATLLRTRVMNGRTVLRIFGRDGIAQDSQINTAREKINVTIDGCILQNAREFILKVGTNRFVREALGAPSFSFKDASGNEYEYNSSACDGYYNDEYFVNNYVLTDVTLKDSILRTSGLFAVGMESHFSGPMLMGSASVLFQLEGWLELAATSYPAMLHLVGDVVLADWKSIASVDSSTLIESNSSQESLAFLSLNIAEMLKTVQAFGGEQYQNIILHQNKNEYVHGGIAFYGGGKNYSVLDTSQYTFEKMNSYNVNLSILANSSDKVVMSQGLFLPLAAGTGDFRFVLFDATSEFDFNAQNKIGAYGTATL